MSRIDRRANDELRSIKMYPYYLDHPHGSTMIEMGKTKVLCTAMIEDGVPKFLKGSGTGWLTAEYDMLPAATPDRNMRSATKGRQNGRTLEIQRLIGRTLRSVVDFEKLGERTIWVDCDVLQADGGTRTASITAGFVAVLLALRRHTEKNNLRVVPVKEYVAAVSVGIVDGEPILDLCYSEDFKAEVDMNVVMTSNGKFIEIQGTAEEEPFDKNQLDELLKLAQSGIKELINCQHEIING